MDGFNDVYRCAITDRLELVSNEPITKLRRQRDSLWIIMETKRPLVVLLPWMGADTEDVDKFVKFYLAKKLDVLIVTTTLWQVLRSTDGFLVTADQLVHFLHEHEYCQPLIIHSFSVANAVWCLAEDRMFGDKQKYQRTIDTVKAQISDSCPMSRDIGRSITLTIFPKDGITRRITECFLKLVFFASAMSVKSHHDHFFRLFQSPLLRAPRLMFISKDDPIAPFDENMRALENWNLLGIKAKVMWWQKSPHVSHFWQHRDEYIKEVENILSTIGLFYQT